MNGDVLSMWHVYDRPKDYPTQYVARRWEVLNEPSATTDIFVADTLDGLRNLLPQGLYRLPASPGDDPVILETWV